MSTDSTSIRSAPDTGSTTSGAGARSEPTSRTPAPAPVKTRRRPAVIALGISLVAVAALAAGWLVQSAGNTQQVLAVTQEVRAGDPLETGDLRVVDLSLDPALDTIPGSELADIVGQRARVTLTPGQTLTRAALTLGPDIARNAALVGVTVTPAQMPAEPLRGGDQILVVDTPNAQDDPPAEPPASIQATVVSTGTVPDTGQSVINVTVERDQAAALAARVATGRIGVVLLPPAVDDTGSGD